MLFALRMVADTGQVVNAMCSMSGQPGPDTIGETPW